MISVLIAVAIVFAPMAAASMSDAAGMGVTMTHTTSHLAVGEDILAASPMEDCASMMKGAAGTDKCPCCDEDKACPPQLCMAKCFQLLGLVQQSRPVVRLVTAHYRPTTPEYPPDWADQPQPPPPRT